MTDWIDATWADPRTLPTWVTEWCGITWVNARAADGPAMAAWIVAVFPDCKDDDNVSRRLREWEDGSNADVLAVDRMLTNLGGHLSMTPDRLWIKGPSRSPGAARRKTRPSRRRVAVLEPKWCEMCGERIPEEYPGGGRKQPGAWVKTRFCSAECGSAAPKRPPEMTLNRQAA